MVNQKSTYSERPVQLAKATLAEVFRALGEYRRNIVLVGGWVPQMQIPTTSPPHVGSLDIDIALDQHAITDDCYASICAVMAELGFTQDTKQRHRFLKEVGNSGETFKVYVDFLAAEYGGRGRKHEHQHVQDIEARKARGCDLALQFCNTKRGEMTLPNGAFAHVEMQVASVATFLVMKAFAMDGRRKDKDAYDIVYCLKNHPDGIEGIVKEYEAILSHGLVREAMEILEREFKTPGHVGPVAVADFLEIGDRDERAIVCRDACERVLELVGRIRA
jgi:hypothetical protein